MAFDIEDFGGVPDWNTATGTGTDNIDAFNAIIAHASRPGFSKNRPIYITANGHFYFSSTLYFTRTIILQGTGANDPQHIPGTMFIFPTNVTGIAIVSTEDLENPTGGSGENSQIRDLTLCCKEDRPGNPFSPLDPNFSKPPIPEQTGYGIRSSITCVLSRCYVSNFGQDGIYIAADNPDIPGNADGFRISHCEVEYCGAHGFHIEGGDAVVGMVENCNATANYGWGFFDESGTGNTYIACCGQGNLGSPNVDIGFDGSNHDFKVINNGVNQSLFIGCYTEDATNDIQFPAGVIGGLLGEGIGGAGRPATTGFALSSGGVVSAAPLVVECNNVATRSRIEIGGGQALPDRVMVIQRTVNVAPTEPSWLEYNPGIDWWSWYNGGANRVVYRLPTTISNVRSSAMWMPNGIFLGNGNDDSVQQLQLAATSPVASQMNGEPRTYEQGDIVWQSAPMAGGWIGAVCVVAGTQGTLNDGLTTGTIKIGTTALAIGDNNHLAVGQRIIIDGVSGVKKIIALTTSIATIDIASDADIAAPVAVSFSAAEFKNFGAIEI